MKQNIPLINNLTRKIGILAVLVLCNLTFSKTTIAQSVSYNFEVDSTNAELREVLNLFENYLSFKPQDQNKSPYWNRADQVNHKSYDFLEQEFQPSLYMGFPVHILAVTKVKGKYLIKAQFGYCQDNKKPYVLAIVNYYVVKEDGHFKLYNALSYNREKWLKKKVGYVTFFYPKYHVFDKEKADNLNAFILELCQNFNVEPGPIEYYLADDYNEIQRLKGIDYYLGMGGESIPTGKASGDKVYCAGLGEYYTHEVFHAQIDSHYPNNHFWVSEGIATFLGGSRGKNLGFHIKRTHEFLKENPEIDLDNILGLTNMDNYTAYHYVLGGLIAKRVYEKGGWSMMIEFMKSGSSDEDYYQAIEKFLGVEKSELNEFIRQELEKESGK